MADYYYFESLPAGVANAQEEDEKEQIRRRMAAMSPELRKSIEILGGISPDDVYKAGGDFDSAKRQKIESYLGTSPTDAARLDVQTQWDKKGKLGKAGSVLAEILGGISGRSSISERTYNQKLKDYQAMAPVLRGTLSDDERNQIRVADQQLKEKKRDDAIIEWAMKHGVDKSVAAAKVAQMGAMKDLTDAKTLGELIKNDVEKEKLAYIQKNQEQMGTTSDKVGEWRRIAQDPEVRKSIMFQSAANALGRGGAGGTTTTTTSGRVSNINVPDVDANTGIYRGNVNMQIPQPPTTRITVRGGGGTSEAIQKALGIFGDQFGQSGPAPTSLLTPPFQARPATEGKPAPKLPAQPRASATPSPVGGAAVTRINLNEPLVKNPALFKEDNQRSEAIGNMKSLRRALTGNPKEVQDFMGPWKNAAIWGVSPGEAIRTYRPGGKSSAETAFDTARAEQIWNTALDKSGKALSAVELDFAKELIPTKTDTAQRAIQKAVSRELLLEVQEVKRRLDPRIRETINSSDIIERAARNYTRRIMAGEKVPEDKYRFKALFPNIPIPE